ncbi:hypothetical protein HDU92_004040 [Lobulomyces angularis]|nr:hypothetical protein HDU92_004040 [Lobulomyces angularis]
MNETSEATESKEKYTTGISKDTLQIYVLLFGLSVILLITIILIRIFRKPKFSDSLQTSTSIMEIGETHLPPYNVGNFKISNDTNSEEVVIEYPPPVYMDQPNLKTKTSSS